MGQPPECQVQPGHVLIHLRFPGGFFESIYNIIVSDYREKIISDFQDGLRIFNIDPIREQAHYTEAMVGSVAKVGNSGIKVVAAVKMRKKMNILKYLSESEYPPAA